MKRILQFLIFFCLTIGVSAQQSVTISNNGAGSGTFNTPGITTYYMGPFTYNFTGSTVIGLSGGGGGGYVLPTASTTVLGGVKIDGSTILINGSGVISTAATVLNYIYPETYGAVGNGIIVNSSAVSISSGSPNLTVTGASFAAGDVGKTITIPGAGATGSGSFSASNGNLTTTISAYVSGTQVTLATNAIHTLTNVAEQVIYGHDDTAAFVSTFAAYQTAGGGSIYFSSPKVYVINPATGLNWITLTSIPVNLQFNGCTIADLTAFTPGSNAYDILFLIQGCAPVATGPVTFIGQSMPQADGTGYTAFDYVESGGVGCSQVHMNTITQTGGLACVEVYRGANVQPVSSRSSGLVFDLIDTHGTYYPLQLQHSGDSTIAHIVCDSAFRPFFVFGMKHAKLNVTDVNHNGSAVIACWNETADTFWSDDPYTSDIDVDYTSLAGTHTRTTEGENMLIEINGPNPNHFENIKVKETVFISSTYPDFILFAAGKLANGSADGTAGRGHILENIEFSATVYNANQGQADLFSFFDSSGNPGGGGVGVGNIGNWAGETINNLYVHDISVQGNAGNTMGIYYGSLYNFLGANLNVPGLAQYGSPNDGAQYVNSIFGGTSIGALNVVTDGIEVGSPTGGDLGTGTINVSGGFYVNNVLVTGGGGGPATAVTKAVTQANFFTLGESLYDNNGTWSAADNVTHPIVSGIVTAATGANFTVTLSGYENTITGLTQNTQYYLGTSGAYVTPAPVGLSSYVIPIFKTGTTGDGVVNIGAPASNAIIGVASGGTGVGTLTGIPYMAATAALAPVTYSGGSIAFTAPNLTLSGDAASPGNTYYYGTNGSGTKGWYALVAGGTVTHTLGALVDNDIVIGNGGNDSKVTAGLATDGTSVLTLGVSGTSAGGIIFNNTTSGTTELVPATGALNSTTVTIPSPTGNDTLALLGTAQSFTAVQTFTAVPVLGTSGTTAGGLTFENATSGSLTLIPATGALGGAYNITIPNTGGADTLDTLGLAQTITATKTFTVAPVSPGYLINNATSGTIELEAPTGALGTQVMTVPDFTDTLAVLGQTQTFSGTLTFSAATLNFSNTTSATTSLLGTVTIGNGTAATNVGIGAGKINAGSTITAGSTFVNNSPASTSGFTTAFNSSSLQTSYVASNSYNSTGTGGTTFSARNSNNQFNMYISSHSSTSAAITNAPASETAVLTTNASVPLYFGTNGSVFAYGDTSQNFNIQNKIAKYNTIATAGWGVPAIQGYGRQTAQSGADSSVATYTVGGSDGSFLVSANVLVTTATLHNFTVTCAYTDEGNTSRVVTLQFSNLAGTFVTAIANAAGAVPYEGVPLHIRCKASTAITIASAAGGTYTTVTYNIEGQIQQID
jgi:hypothetical protein